MNERVSRRSLLRGSAGLAGLGLTNGAAARAGGAPEAIVFYCLRGGADGLSLLVPYTDERYYAARRVTAIAPPGATSASALRLDERFGLHPRLGALRDWFQAGELGAVPSVGLPSLVRSHQRAWRELDAGIVNALGGAEPASTPGSTARQLGWLSEALKRGAPAQAWRIDSGGWDVHAAQGDAVAGRLAGACHGLAAELVALRSAIGARAGRVLVVVLTEFGRSLAETPLAGTDDGHASVMFVLGGPRRWGAVLGSWPGLAPEKLSGGRHVRPTTDIRTALERLVRGEAPA